MSMFARLKSWFRASSQRADFEREMQDEMRVHSSSTRRNCGGRASRRPKPAGGRSPSSAASKLARRNAAKPSACGCSTSCAAT